MNSLDETISAITFVYAWYSANEQLPESICDLDEDLSEFSRVSTNMYRKFKTKAWAYVRNVIIDQEYMHRVSKKGNTKLVEVTLLILNRFSIHFLRQIRQILQ